MELIVLILWIFFVNIIWNLIKVAWKNWDDVAFFTKLSARITGKKVWTDKFRLPSFLKSSEDIFLDWMKMADYMFWKNIKGQYEVKEKILKARVFHLFLFIFMRHLSSRLSGDKLYFSKVEKNIYLLKEKFFIKYWYKDISDDENYFICEELNNFFSGEMGRWDFESLCSRLLNFILTWQSSTYVTNFLLSVSCVPAFWYIIGEFNTKIYETMIDVQNEPKILL